MIATHPKNPEKNVYVKRNENKYKDKNGNLMVIYCLEIVNEFGQELKKESLQEKTRSYLVYFNGKKNSGS